MTTNAQMTGMLDLIQGVSEELRHTSPWITFFGWMGLIGSVLALAIGGVVLVANLTDASGGDLFGYIGGAFVLMVAGVSFYISAKLRTVSSALKSFAQQPNQTKLMNVISLHNGYWRAAALAAALLAVANIVAFGFTYNQS